MALDHYLFIVINQYAGQNILVDNLFIFFAEYLVAAFIIFFIIEFKNAKATTTAIFSSLIAVFFKIGLSLAYFRPRPFVTYNVHLLIDHLNSASFPSTHAAVSFALATSIFLYNRKSGVAAYGIAILVSIARVFVGVHYPLDILGGAAIGILAAVAVDWPVKKYYDALEQKFLSLF